MCFSATVSYGAATVLVATGTITTLKNKLKEQRMIAAIPFLFGIQQAAEGIVWQTLRTDSAAFLGHIGSVLFVTVALVIWPSWLPWSLYQIEQNEKRKRILKAIGIMGLIVSCLAAWVLSASEVHAYQTGHSLGYTFHNVRRFWPASLDFLLYDIPTLVPFFVSSLRTVKIAGVLVFLGMMVAAIVNREASTSIWCFFAALISFYIAWNVLWVQRGRIA
ncbi:DUF6629 family protein [Bdellovibrio reynosensis]|uniref:Peptidase S54 rhomboid domain-containing protein n=1 Tax=Bdellovibrio reynosensis TaxID=2835041 RepID=A0ABY4CFL1_9BACT|nr:DUF6629 family protein [Bdellovibrio reynosensis]UOF02461.1 hypothetical protein MNR06_05795 [Bdellovibrio reynosensis]